MSEPYVEINSPDHGTFAFYDAETTHEFLQAQIVHWDWVREQFPSLYNHLNSLISNVINHLGSGNLQEQTDQTFVWYRFPFVGSAMTKFIDTVAHEQGVHIASLIIAYITRHKIADFSDPESLRAIGLLITFDQKLSTKSIEATQASLKRTLTSFARQEASARAQGTKYERKIDSVDAWAEKARRTANKYLAHKIKMQRRADDARLKASLDEMTATRALYMEHMALKAPVEYWTRKATAHGTQGKLFRSTLVKFAIWGGLGVVAALLALAIGAIFAINAGVPTSVLVVLATVGVVITTIVFWAGRILTRLYLSEVHLSIDASERATMVETYLALTSIGQASKEERAIILGSLFRPTADGIVKDDSAPDLSPAGILSRLGTP